MMKSPVCLSGFSGRNWDGLLQVHEKLWEWGSPGTLAGLIPTGDIPPQPGQSPLSCTALYPVCSQGFTGLESSGGGRAGSLLGPLSVLRVIIAHTTQISALFYLTGSRTALGVSFSLGVLCWQHKPNLLLNNNKCLYALLSSSLMLLFANLFVRFGVRCKISFNLIK